MITNLHPEKPYHRWIQRLKDKLNSERKPGTRKFVIGDLLALSLYSDPYYAGSGDRLREAQWFQQVWEKVGAGIGFHLRRIHYALLDLDFKKPDNKSYTNTQEDWLFLNSASRQARHLELVDADLLTDRKNPEHIIPSWVEALPVLDPDVVVPDLPDFRVPFIVMGNGNLEFESGPSVDGYDDDEYLDRAAYCECWIEKTSQNDILVPLCEELGIGLVAESGRQSIISVVQFLKRVSKLGKPGRILYISDFDPAGEQMPLGVARQLEFYRSIHAPNAQVSLNPLALTEEQVRRYRLPRIPLKASDRSAAGFQKQHGDGGCELDALESRRPGELERLIRAAVEQYDDVTLPVRLEEERDRAQDHVMEVWQKETQKLQEQLATVRAEIQRATRKYFPKVENLQSRMERELRPYQQRLRKLERQFTEVIENFDVQLEERPMPEIEPEEKDWLFDSRRDYMTQLEHYKRRKTGPEGRFEGTGHSLAMRRRGKNKAKE